MNVADQRSDGETTGWVGRFVRRISAALPSTRELWIGAPLWGATMSTSALIALYWRHGAETSQLGKILLLFFAGGLVAWPFSVFLGRFSSLGRRPETRFAAHFLCFTVLTIAATAFFFAMQYRLFYARWHEPFGTRIWAYQFVFTSLGATYQFVVMGMRLFLPFGFVALAAVSLWYARHTHR